MAAAAGARLVEPRVGCADDRGVRVLARAGAAAGGGVSPAQNQALGMGSLKANCGTCNAWLKQPGGKQGLCRANPPLPIMLGMKSKRRSSACPIAALPSR